MSDRYVHLKLVHPPVGSSESGTPQRFSGRNIVLQVVDGDEVLGYLGGVTSVSEHFPLDGVMHLELTVGAFFEAIADDKWPASKVKT